MTTEIRTIAVRGVIWSVAQNWGGRIVTFFMFAVLARLLSPADYGVVSAGLMVVAFVGLISEFGFGDAIIQRKDVASGDLTLPFLVSMAVSVILSIVIAVFADTLEVRLNAPGLAPVLMVLSPIASLMTLSSFQEMNYRRSLMFKKLALRVLIANVVGGVAAIGFAATGFGLWALVVQNYVIVVIGLIWLWRHPVWVPDWKVNFASFIGLGRFALPVIGMRLVDFVAMRWVEFIIITKYGVAAFGIYTVASKLYQILLQLLQGVLNDVSLPVLSLVAGDRERLASIYLKTMRFSAVIPVPAFILLSALSPEICNVMFGQKWAGIDQISQPLLALGAVHCVQYLNSPYLYARGRPEKSFLIVVFKYTILALGLLLYPTGNTRELILLFVALQLMATPISFYFVLDELAVRTTDLLRTLLPSAIGCGFAYFAVIAARPFFSKVLIGDLLLGTVLSATFVCIYGIYAMIFMRRQVTDIFSAFVDAVKRKREHSERKPA